MLQMTHTRGPGRPPKYPWRQMEVGDTFFVPGRTQRCLRKDAAAYRPMQFRIKTVMVKGEIGVRVWRIA